MAGSHFESEIFSTEYSGISTGVRTVGIGRARFWRLRRFFRSFCSLSYLSFLRIDGTI